MENFILLAHPRSGSTLLARALRQHQSIRMFGELFNDEEEERKQAFRFGKPALNDGKQVQYHWENNTKFYQDSEDAATFLDTEVFNGHSEKETLVVGFKIHYNQAYNNTNAMKAWNYLSRNRDIRVVHLKRRNLLACFLSLQLARMTGIWIQPKGSKTDLVQPNVLTFDPTVCKAYFDETIARREYLERVFSEHRTMEIEYEKDICSHFASTMQEIQWFLKVPYQPLPLLLEKQAQYKPQEQISNYEELRNHFRGTSYENFFE